MGFRTPEWGALARGLRPEGFPVEEEVGPRHVGWQRVATVDANNFFKVTAVWPRLNVAALAGRPSRRTAICLLPDVFPHVIGSPSVPRPPFVPPLAPTKRICGCGRLLDSTLLATTVQHAQMWVCWAAVGSLLKSAAAHVCREAGARVSVNQFVRDLDIAAPNAADTRRLEVVADGLPLFHGAQLAIDTTMVSPLSREGVPHARCAEVDGAALEAARRRKERRYPELVGEDGRARSVVLACEVGGRFSEECRHFLRQLSKAKVRGEPPLQRVRHAWLFRWGSMWACAGARALALSLLDERGGQGVDGPTPPSHDVIWDARYVV